MCVSELVKSDDIINTLQSSIACGGTMLRTAEFEEYNVFDGATHSR